MKGCTERLTLASLNVHRPALWSAAEGILANQKRPGGYYGLWRHMRYDTVRAVQNPNYDSVL